MTLLARESSAGWGQWMGIREEFAHTRASYLRKESVSDLFLFSHCAICFISVHSHMENLLLVYFYGFAWPSLKRLGGYIFTQTKTIQCQNNLTKIVLQILNLASSRLPPRIVKPQRV